MKPEKQRCGSMNRREFLVTSTLAAAGLAAGCATNPVTGKRQLMLMSEQEEVNLDRQNSPHQFSADYGAVQDPGLNEYISEVGSRVAAVSHRMQMPYNYRVVNAAYINAYAFPGGSIAATRGIMLKLEDESELAGLLGHELGHVNARHTAERMSKNMLTMAVVAGTAVYMEHEESKYAGLAAGLGMIGAGMLLAKYSRDNERQADDLGLRYMVLAGYNPQGFIGLMDMLSALSHGSPNSVELLFSTHPMSDERHDTAVRIARDRYADEMSRNILRERYMDHTVSLRKIQSAVDAMQQGDGHMMANKYPDAQAAYAGALTIAPRDYAAHLMMAKCLIAMENFAEAARYADAAAEIYPEEPQALHISGIVRLHQKNYEAAYDRFEQYEIRLPGNPNTVFLKGITLELQDKKDPAAKEYYRFLQDVTQGSEADYAYNRLVEWGYINTQQK